MDCAAALAGPSTASVAEMSRMRARVTLVGTQEAQDAAGLAPVGEPEAARTGIVQPVGQAFCGDFGGGAGLHQQFRGLVMPSLEEHAHRAEALQRRSATRILVRLPAVLDQHPDNLGAT